ncbi:Serine hydroxymethyltransferase [Eubacterium plexicaudatum ASF492]|nr:Serine hydroxymethyltransferase [Eubacterium plexicaudatum ASF492]
MDNEALEMITMHKILKKYMDLNKELIENENNKIPLCAAETYISDFCKQPLLSEFEGKYSFIDKDNKNAFIGGEYVQQLNELLTEECKILFNADYTNADTLTGINCFTVCAMSLISRNDRVLVTTPEQGGHASIPIILNSLGISYDPVPYDYESYQIDYSKINDMCRTQKYKFIIFANRIS